MDFSLEEEYEEKLKRIKRTRRTYKQREALFQEYKAHLDDAVNFRSAGILSAINQYFSGDCCVTFTKDLIQFRKDYEEANHDENSVGDLRSLLRKPSRKNFNRILHILRNIPAQYRQYAFEIMERDWTPTQRYTEHVHVPDWRLVQGYKMHRASQWQRQRTYDGLLYLRIGEEVRKHMPFVGHFPDLKVLYLAYHPRWNDSFLEDQYVRRSVLTRMPDDVKIFTLNRRLVGEHVCLLNWSTIEGIINTL